MQTTSPEAVGMSSDRLARITPTMQTYIDSNRLAGIATLIVRQGQIVHSDTVGYQDKEADVPLQDDTIYRIYSMTKPIVSVALMQLYEQGKFQLYDPVAKYIPAFGKTKVCEGTTVTGLKLTDQTTPMTIQHLLTHTSGLSYGSYHDTPVDALYRDIDRSNPDVSLETMVNTLAEIPLAFQPGTQWRYSLATDVCGYLVQVISGMPLETYLDENIFQPLNMVDTAFVVPADKVNRFSAVYTFDSDDQLKPLIATANSFPRDYTIPTKCPSGGGGLVSTMSDYMNFCSMLINRGKFNDQQLIGRKTLAFMASNHLQQHMIPYSIGSSVRPGYGFGLGFRVLVDAPAFGLLSSLGEYGWAGAANTYFWIDPKEDLYGIFMNQYLGGQDRPKARETFQALTYQALID